MRAEFKDTCVTTVGLPGQSPGYVRNRPVMGALTVRVPRLLTFALSLTTLIPTNLQPSIHISAGTRRKSERCLAARRPHQPPGPTHLSQCHAPMFDHMAISGCKRNASATSSATRPTRRIVTFGLTGVWDRANDGSHRPHILDGLRRRRSAAHLGQSTLFAPSTKSVQHRPNEWVDQQGLPAL